MQNLIPYFPKAKEYIQHSLIQGKILVYCNGGISRAPAMVIAYLMESCGMDFQSAYHLVQTKYVFFFQKNTRFIE